MMKIMMIVMALTGLFTASIVQAEVARVGKVYRAGSVVEMPNSGAMVSIPFGWVARLQSGTHNFDLVNVQHPAEQKVTLQDKGFNYSAAISDANRPLTLTNGMQIPQDGSARKLPGQQQGKMFFYSMPYKPGQQLNALSVISKAPSGKAVVFKSAGLNLEKDALTQNIQTVMQGLSFAGQAQQSSPQMAGMNPALMRGQNVGRNNVAAASQRSSGYMSNSDRFGVQKPSAEAHSTGSANGSKNLQRHTNNESAKSQKSSREGNGGKSVKFAKGNPFKKGHGMGVIPRYQEHSRKGLYLHKANPKIYYTEMKNSGHSTLLNHFRFMNGHSRVIFCSEDDVNLYRGIYIIDEFFENGWRSTGTGRYQLYSTKPFERWSSSYVKQPDDIMFIDRSDGSSLALKVKTLKFDGGYWGDEMSFNGFKFIQKGVSKKCSAKSFGGMDMKQASLKGSAAEIRSSNPTSNSYSSSGSYDTHFGTDSSGRTFFSAPGVSGCSGC